LGIILLWKAVKNGTVPPSGKTAVGASLLGWGLFNLVEGIIDHRILARAPRGGTTWGIHFDYAFLAPGVLLIVVRLLVIMQTFTSSGARRMKSECLFRADALGEFTRHAIFRIGEGQS
jgi:uncharacterized membrane protein